LNGLRYLPAWRYGVIAAGVLAMVGGCGQRDEIASYEVPKPELVDPTLVSRPSATPGAAQQTLGVILPAGETSWFFKLTGPKDAVEPLEPAFLEFLKSVKLAKSEGAEPTWTLPEGWQQLPGSQFRFATVRVPATEEGGKAQEISVSQAGGDVLGNVNRWREQLSLPPVAAADLDKDAKMVEIDGREATYVNLVGTGSGGMGGGAPFAPFAGGQLPPDHPPIGPGTNASEARK
jgi:hypothetical protein